MASAAAPRHGRAPDLPVRPVIATPDPAPDGPVSVGALLRREGRRAAHALDRPLVPRARDHTDADRRATAHGATVAAGALLAVTAVLGSNALGDPAILSGVAVDDAADSGPAVAPVPAPMQPTDTGGSAERAVAALQDAARPVPALADGLPGVSDVVSGARIVAAALTRPPAPEGGTTGSSDPRPTSGSDSDSARDRGSGSDARSSDDRDDDRPGRDGDRDDDRAGDRASDRGDDDSDGGVSGGGSGTADDDGGDVVGGSAGPSSDDDLGGSVGGGVTGGAPSDGDGGAGETPDASGDSPAEAASDDAGGAAVTGRDGSDQSDQSDGSDQSDEAGADAGNDAGADAGNDPGEGAAGNDDAV